MLTAASTWVAIKLICYFSIVLSSKIVRLSVSSKLIDVPPKICETLLIFWLPSFEFNSQNPTRIYKLRQKNLEDITAADRTYECNV